MSLKGALVYTHWLNQSAKVCFNILMFTGRFKVCKLSRFPQSLGGRAWVKGNLIGAGKLCEWEHALKAVL